MAIRAHQSSLPGEVKNLPSILARQQVAGMAIFNNLTRRRRSKVKNIICSCIHAYDTLTLRTMSSMHMSFVATHH